MTSKVKQILLKIDFRPPLIAKSVKNYFGSHPSVVSGKYSISHDDQDGQGGQFGCDAQVGHILGW